MIATHYEMKTKPVIPFVEGSLVFLNGVFQRRGEDYTKDSFAGTVKFKRTLVGADVVAVVEQE